MRPSKFVALALSLLLLLLVVLRAAGSNHPAAALIFPTPPPLGVALVVDTTTYPGVLGDGLCSLDEAINAANINGHADACNASASQPGATDGISFANGITTINVTSTPPAITTPMSINGGSGRVVLHGSGSGSGLYVSGAGAAGTSIRNLVINNFNNGIYIDTASTKVTIAGNYIGTNVTGTAAVPNGTGIYGYYQHSQLQIGGLSGLTPGGPCTGDCNLISGNTNDGVYLYESSGDLVEGNFIGTNAAGTAALGNGGDGIRDWEFTNVTIGGTASGAGNLISGNEYGIEVWWSQPIIKGNFVGTNASGTSAIPNTNSGIYVHDNTQYYAFTIGGTEAGAGNVISGNTQDGVLLSKTDQVTFYGNVIGTQPDRVGPLGNGGAAVATSDSSVSNVIGGIQAGQGNVMANNGAAGVHVGVYGYHNEIRGNSIHDNAGKAIQLDDQQDGNAPLPPVITSASGTGASGTACASCTVDVYSDNGDEGRFYEGSTTAYGTGLWSYNGSLTGPRVTATNTASQLDTSEFSTPYILPATPTPTPSPTPSPTSSPTSTATATATPTFTAKPSPTPTPVHTVTHTPSPSGKFGDANCDGGIDLEDVEAVLSAVGGVSPGAPCSALADANCNEHLDADDALRILAFEAGAPLPQPSGCSAIGTHT